MINIYTKRGLICLTALFILVFALFFCFIFLVPLNLLEVWPDWLLYLVVFVIFFMLQIVLFSRDVLYYGDPRKNRYAKAFQMYWPSKYIATKFHLSQKDASFYWFEKYFNAWRNSKHPRHSQWERTLRRGYSCRFVYYSLKFFEILLAISIGATLIQEIVSKLFRVPISTTGMRLWWRVIFILFIVLLYAIVRVSNRASPSKLTGVWKRYAEINQMHIKWIDENIKSINDLKNPRT